HLELGLPQCGSDSGSPVLGHCQMIIKGAKVTAGVVIDGPAATDHGACSSQEPGSCKSPEPGAAHGIRRGRPASAEDDESTVHAQPRNVLSCQHLRGAGRRKTEVDECLIR